MCGGGETTERLNYNRHVNLFIMERENHIIEEIYLWWWWDYWESKLGRRRRQRRRRRREKYMHFVCFSSSGVGLTTSIKEEADSSTSVLASLIHARSSRPPSQSSDARKSVSPAPHSSYSPLTPSTPSAVWKNIEAVHVCNICDCRFTQPSLLAIHKAQVCFCLFMLLLLLLLLFFFSLSVEDSTVCISTCYIQSNEWVELLGNRNFPPE
jgi:hypothetical protein